MALSTPEQLSRIGLKRHPLPWPFVSAACVTTVRVRASKCVYASRQWHRVGCVAKMLNAIHPLFCILKSYVAPHRGCPRFGPQHQAVTIRQSIRAGAHGGGDSGVFTSASFCWLLKRSIPSRRERSMLCLWPMHVVRILLTLLRSPRVCDTLFVLTTSMYVPCCTLSYTPGCIAHSEWTLHYNFGFNRAHARGC